MLQVFRSMMVFCLFVACALSACGGGGGGDGDGTSAPPPPNPLFVRTSGSDANSGGDPSDALQTISKAASLARTGYRIFVGAGVYHEGVTTVSLGVAADSVWFIADVSGDQTGDRGPVVIDGTGTRGTAGFNLFNTRDSRIDGFTITGFPDAGIVIKNNSDNFIVQNCMVFGNAGDGIRVQDSANVLVFNNLVYGNGGTGLGIVGQISGSPDAQVLSNTVVVNSFRGITIGNSQRASPGAVVFNNILQGNLGDSNIKVFTEPPSDLDYDGNYNLVFPADSYLPSSIRGANDYNGMALFTSDFHVQMNSPTINRGGPLNLPNAQTNILRGRTTDGTNLDRGVFDLGFHFLRN